jgi:4-amino-4-deoxy-L-arabinose transferase-like glycosyltransferase
MTQPKHLAILFALLLLGLGIRLFDLTDQPLDFHPTRQLLSALVARGMYYEIAPAADPALREQALRSYASLESYEPPILNRLVALTYLALGAELLWAARLYSALFWVIGGIPLFLLARRLVSARAGLVSLAFYLFLPFAVLASRSFQVDPLVVMLILWSVYALHRWADSHEWKWAAAGGLLSGLTILVKVTAAFPLIGAALALVLSAPWLWRQERGRFLPRLLKTVLSPQAWVLAALAAAPGALYYLVSLSERSGGYFDYWTLSMWQTSLNLGLYIRWMSFVHRFLDLSLVFLALGGVLIASPRLRPLLVGLWGGYLVYGTFFPFQIRTHDYYHLVLVPIMALSFAPLAEIFLERLEKQPRLWQAAFAGVALAAMAYPLWTVRNQLLVDDFRAEPAGWQALAAQLPEDGPIIALTHDYGYRLKYYGWRDAAQVWPVGIDLELAAQTGSGAVDEEFFSRRTEGMRYFLVTLPGELERQPWLKDLLYERYPLIRQGDGWLLFDLQG